MWLFVTFYNIHSHLEILFKIIIEVQCTTGLWWICVVFLNVHASAIAKEIGFILGHHMSPKSVQCWGTSVRCDMRVTIKCSHINWKNINGPITERQCPNEDVLTTRQSRNFAQIVVHKCHCQSTAAESYSNNASSRILMRCLAS